MITLIGQIRWKGLVFVVVDAVGEIAVWVCAINDFF